MSHPCLKAYGNSSSSALSEMEDPDFDAAPIAFRNAGGRWDTAETSVKLEYSSEDVKERHRDHAIEAKNTWAPGDSEKSDTGSMASRTVTIQATQRAKHWISRMA